MRRSVFSVPGLLGFRSSTLGAIGVVFFSAGFSLTAFAAEDFARSISDRVQEIFALHRDAVVRIESSDRHGRLEGTGFYADPSGTIYTLVGVIGDGTDITVHQGERKFPAQLLLADRRTGLAMIKVDAHTPFVPIGDSSKLSVNSPVVSIGYPQGRPEAASLGLVAGFDKVHLKQRFYTTHVRLDLPIKRGLGGAPVLDVDGKAVGIIVASVDGNAGGFMLPINAAEKVRLDYIRFGEIRQGWIGIDLEESGDTSAPSTARVARLHPSTPAAESGIRDGDIVTRVGKFTLTCPEDVFDASFFLSAGDTVAVSVIRDGKELDFEVRSILHPSLQAAKTADDLPMVDRMPAFDLDRD